MQQAVTKYCGHKRVLPVATNIMPWAGRIYRPALQLVVEMIAAINLKTLS